MRTWMSDVSKAVRKLYDIINVKDYPGVYGDGRNDDTVGIQKALDDGGARRVPVFFPAGTYRITAALNLTQSYSSVYGEYNRTTIRLDSAVATEHALKLGFTGAQVDVFNVENFIFERAQAGANSYAIAVEQAALVNILNCRVYGTANYYNRGVNFYRVLISEIRDCYLQLCTNGIYLQGLDATVNVCGDIKILNNRIECDTGLLCYDFVSGLYCRNNIFYACATAGISVSASSNANGLNSFKFQDNDVDTCGTGLYVDKISNVQITDGWFSANNGSNIYSTDSVDGLVVADNQIYGLAAYNCIDLAAQNAVINGNLLIGGLDGILMYAASVNSTIVGNQITSMASYGVNKFLAPDAVTIQANTFRNNALGNITAGGTNLNVGNNNLL